VEEQPVSCRGDLSFCDEGLQDPNDLFRLSAIPPSLSLLKEKSTGGQWAKVEPCLLKFQVRADDPSKSGTHTATAEEVKAAQAAAKAQDDKG
jgi:hypothetical protein